MLGVLMGRYHHIVQIQPLLQPTYIDIDPNQSNFHEDRTVKLRIISSKMIMMIQKTNFQLVKMREQSQMQVLMINKS